MRFQALVVAFALAASGAQAADPTRPKLGSGSYPAPTLHGELQLSLADAIAMGLENNLGVEIQRHEPLIAHEDYRAAWGFYDPALVAEFGYADTEDPTGNVLVGTPVISRKLMEGFGGIQGLVPWLGASYDLRISGSDDRVNSGIQALSPELRSSVSAAVTLPLLRDLIWNEPWTLVKTTRVLEDSARERFRTDVMETVQAIEQSYWALIADEERVRVAEKSLETARALLDQVTTQYEVGVVSKVEIAQGEAGVADRDFNLIVAQNTYRNTMDRLIDLVLGPNLTADSRIQIEPTDRPDQITQLDLDPERSTELAFHNRPELAVAEQELERLEINLRFRKNQRLPRVDAQLSWGNRGIAGFANPDCAPPFCTPTTIGGFDETFKTPGSFFTSDAATQLTARALVSIPFPNTTGRANVSKAELELRRAHVEKRRVEQDIILEVRRAVRNIASAREGIEAAQRGVAAAAEQLRAERIRLEYGESTPFDVLLREEDLVTAESQEIAAFQTYRTALTDLDRAQGTILRNRNVQIEEVARLR